jgi:chaperone required for assembly of F1-ATPase
MANMNDTEQPKPKPRKFYSAAAALPQGETYAVALDGRVAKSPGGRPLAVPTLALAELLTQEWNAQGELIDFNTMPATRLAFTALDRAADAHQALAAEVARYAGSDLLCYRAEGPQVLAQRQKDAWDPWLAWADAALDIQLHVAEGIMHRAQPEESLEKAAREAEALGDFALAGLAFATALYGSAVLAFAVMKGALDAATAHDLSRLDEAFQEERWGVDEEAALRTAARAQEASMIGAWFAALRQI